MQTIPNIISTRRKINRYGPQPVKSVFVTPKQNQWIHAQTVNPITITAVMAVAVKTISGLVREQIIPTRMLNRAVKTSMMGSPYFCSNSEKQPITIENTISRTETTIIAAVLPNTFLKLSDFMAQRHTNAVITSCILSMVQTFLTKPDLELAYRSSPSSPFLLQELSSQFISSMFLLQSFRLFVRAWLIWLRNVSGGFCWLLKQFWLFGAEGQGLLQDIFNNNYYHLIGQQSLSIKPIKFDKKNNQTEPSPKPIKKSPKDLNPILVQHNLQQGQISFPMPLNSLLPILLHRFLFSMDFNQWRKSGQHVQKFVLLFVQGFGNFGQFVFHQFDLRNMAAFQLLDQGVVVVHHFYDLTLLLSGVLGQVGSLEGSAHALVGALLFYSSQSNGITFLKSVGLNLAIEWQILSVSSA